METLHLIPQIRSLEVLCTFQKMHGYRLMHLHLILVSRGTNPERFHFGCMLLIMEFPIIIIGKLGFMVWVDMRMMNLGQFDHCGMAQLIEQ